MSRALKNAAAFVREAAATRRLWTARNLAVAPRGLAGHLAQPFWSSAERAATALATGKLGTAAEAVEVSWEEFVRDWVPRLEAADVRVGPNWGGPDCTGAAWTAGNVVESVEDEARGESLA